MFWLGLLLPISFIAGYTGATIPGQWPVLTIALLPALWKKAQFTFFHWLGVAFLLYAFATFFWSSSKPDSVYGLWLALIWGLSFWYGTTSDSLVPLWKGLALGLSVSSAICIAFAFGFTPIPTFLGGNAGLLFNTTTLAASAALVILGHLSEGLWLYIPSLLPALYLAHSRGGWLMLAVGLISRFVHWYLSLIITLVAGIYFLAALSSSDDARVHTWATAFHGLSPFGWGIGTFIDVYYAIGDHLIHPEYAHNDYLQLWFELGLGALPIYCILAWALTRAQSKAWPVLVAFCTAELFYFPLYCPIPAFIACVVAGHLLREHDPLRDLRSRWRQRLLPRHAASKPTPRRPRPGNLPVGL